MADPYVGEEHEVAQLRPRSVLPASVAVLALLVAGAVGAATVGRSKSGHQVAVFSAVDNALASRTADVTITQHLGSLVSKATGTVDFTTGQVTAAMTGEIDGHTVNATVEFTHGVAYEHFPQLDQVEPGKTWLEIDLSSLGAGGNSSTVTGQGNPAAMLKLISSQDGHVSPPSSTTIGGIPVQVYRVDFNVAALEQRLSQPQMPDWIRQSVSATSIEALTNFVYIDSSDHLRRMDTDATMNSSGRTVQLQQTATFTKYGVPMPAITIPTASETMTIEQLLQDVKAAQASSTAS